MRVGSENGRFVEDVEKGGRLGGVAEWVVTTNLPGGSLAGLAKSGASGLVPRVIQQLVGCCCRLSHQARCHNPCRPPIKASLSTIACDSQQVARLSTKPRRPTQNQHQIRPASRQQRASRDASNGTMRRLNLVLLVSLQLCGAHHPGFSIHDDLLAHPQVRLRFSSYMPAVRR